MCVCERERERERESACVCVRERVCECVCVCVCARARACFIRGVAGGGYNGKFIACIIQRVQESKIPAENYNYRLLNFTQVKTRTTYPA